MYFDVVMAVLLGYLLLLFVSLRVILTIITFYFLFPRTQAVKKAPSNLRQRIPSLEPWWCAIGR